MADQNDGGADPEVIVAVVALLVSLVALVATFMQVMQQYYASAAGYQQCNAMVMGRWADSKTRRFSWDELRFEVEFEAPVIFLCSPDNTDGPVAGDPIYFLTGTQSSLDETWSEMKIDQRADYMTKTRKERVHTADNERASWTILLSAVHRMEHDSRTWQTEQYTKRGPISADQAEQDGFLLEPPNLDKHHTLTVALQKKRKSWDTMPPTVSRPYATTTVCHLIELMATLGVYWKEFDRKRDRYRAEGNGFMVLGEKVSDLGLMFTFSISGKSKFGRNRVIPVDEVKELCFGYVPTIYRETLDQRRLEAPGDEPQNLASLQMATRNELSETLIVIGCNNNAVRCFRDPGKHTSHLFPVSFEILGMLSRTFYIKGSMFTFIPNPTCDMWDKRSLSLVKVMEAYKEFFGHQLPTISRNRRIFLTIARHIATILNSHQNRDAAEQLRFLNALREALNDCDEILTAKRPGVPGTPMPVGSDQETEKQSQRREIVQDVLRSHIQLVLALLNEDDRMSDAMSLRTGWAPTSAVSRSDQPRPPMPRFEDMHEASPDERQHKFMDVYFNAVRPQVVDRARSTTDRRASITVPTGHGFRRTGTLRTQASSIREVQRPTSPTPPLPRPDTPSKVAPETLAIEAPVTGDNFSEISTDDEMKPEFDLPLGDETVSHDDVWCTLIFRMICWLMLHDFNKLDVQITKSELLGSRMPVYIA